MHFLLIVFLFISSASISAEEALDTPPGLAPAPELPDLPEPVQSGETLEPDITIIEKAQETVQEYRVNGRLYMVKVTPRRGAAYYLVDNDGDGQLETRTGDPAAEIVVPQWIILSW